MHYLPLPWLGTGRAGAESWFTAGPERKFTGAEGGSCGAGGGGCSDGGGMPGFCWPGGASGMPTVNSPQTAGGCPGSLKVEGIIACPVVGGGPG
jgi:hypothetical protein